MFSREHVVENGKAAFYACIYGDLRKVAMECGWALGLHGSLSSDMDIMAMPWAEDAKPVEDIILALSDCFTENPFKDTHTIPHYDKPNNRVVYTMSIWADFYLDINVIQPKTKNMIIQNCDNADCIYNTESTCSKKKITINHNGECNDSAGVTKDGEQF